MQYGQYTTALFDDFTSQITMFYRILADTTLLVHLFFIIFVVIGGFLALRQSWLILLHFPALIWGVCIEFTGKICPLTPLENSFNYLAGIQGYTGSFIHHYFIGIIYPAGLSRQMQIILGLSVIIVNLIPYGLITYRFLLSRQGR